MMQLTLTYTYKRQSFPSNQPINEPADHEDIGCLCPLKHIKEKKRSHELQNAFSLIEKFRFALEFKFDFQLNSI